MTILDEQCQVINRSSQTTLTYQGYEFIVDETERGTVTVTGADRVYVGDQLVWVRGWDDKDLEIFKGYLYKFLKGKNDSSEVNLLRIQIKTDHSTSVEKVAEAVAAEIRSVGNPKVDINYIGYGHTFDARASTHGFEFTILKGK